MLFPIFLLFFLSAPPLLLRAEWIALLRVCLLRTYCKSQFNIFDCVVVLFSLTEIILEQVSGNGNNTGLSALRSFRLLRVFRLAKTWKDLQVQCAISCRTECSGCLVARSGGGFIGLA